MVDEIDPRDEARRKADLEWLYGQRRDQVDHTQVLRPKPLPDYDSDSGNGWASSQTPGVAPRDNLGTRWPSGEPISRPAKSTAYTRISQPASAPTSAATGGSAGGSFTHYAPGSGGYAHSGAAAAPSHLAGPGTSYLASAGDPGQQIPSKKAKKRKLHPFRWILLLLIAWLIFLVTVPVVSLSKAHRVDNIPTGQRPAEHPGTATLIVGSDSRANLSSDEQSELGTGNVAGHRADTMMILYQPKIGKPALISLPRDSYVEIPGHGKNKLNAAYAYGGGQLLTQTVEQATGVRIDGYMEIGFAGFVGLVDAVGGVDVCLDKPMVDRDSHTNLPAGCRTLNGTEALGYVRMRKADPTGDIGRAKRQREVVAGVMKKAASPWTVINPIRYYQTVTNGVSTLTLGKETSLSTMLSVMRAMYSLSKDQGYSIVVPISNPNAKTKAGSSVLWDNEAAAEMFGMIISGDTSGLEKFKK